MALCEKTTCRTSRFFMLNYIMYSMGTLGFDFRIVPSGFRRTFYIGIDDPGTFTISKLPVVSNDDSC